MRSLGFMTNSPLFLLRITMPTQVVASSVPTVCKRKKEKNNNKQGGISCITLKNLEIAYFTL